MLEGHERFDMDLGPVAVEAQNISRFDYGGAQYNGVARN